MAQLASKVSPSGPKRNHLEPFLRTFGHLGHSFTHFYAFLSGFHEHLCIFAESYNGKFSKIQKIALKLFDFAQKDRKQLKSV